MDNYPVLTHWAKVFRRSAAEMYVVTNLYRMPSDSKLQSLPLIDFAHVNVQRGERIILRDFNLTINAGENVAIVGPNGCGKSTLLKTITREIYPLALEETRVQILGRDRWNVMELREHLGIVSNDLLAHPTRDLTGRDLVISGFFSSIGVWPHQTVTDEMRRKADDAIERLGVAQVADQLVDTMSSGEARRIMIARALIHDPQALILDEPSNSLDIGALQDLLTTMRRLTQSGTNLILVTHHLPEIIPEITRVVLMRDGQIFRDGPKEEVMSESALSELFRMDVHLHRNDGYFHLSW